jgi:hypothetical protein
MKESSSRLLAVALTGLVFAGLTPKLVQADDLKWDLRTRRVGTEASGPIGTVYSLGGVSINRLSTAGEQAIWNGDLVEVSGVAGAHIVLDSMAKVRLRQGNTIRQAREQLDSATQL